jgi:hypothetical protein
LNFKDSSFIKFRCWNKILNFICVRLVRFYYLIWVFWIRLCWMLWKIKRSLSSFYIKNNFIDSYDQYCIPIAIISEAKSCWKWILFLAFRFLIFCHYNWFCKTWKAIKSKMLAYMLIFRVKSFSFQIIFDFHPRMTYQLDYSYQFI